MKLVLFLTSIAMGLAACGEVGQSSMPTPTPTPAPLPRLTGSETPSELGDYNGALFFVEGTLTQSFGDDGHIVKTLHSSVVLSGSVDCIGANRANGWSVDIIARAQDIGWTEDHAGRRTYTLHLRCLYGDLVEDCVPLLHMEYTWGEPSGGCSGSSAPPSREYRPGTLRCYGQPCPSSQGPS